MKRRLLVSIAVLALAVSAFAVQQTPGKPGKWEITTTLQMPGMPAHPVVHTICVTKQDLEKNPESMIPNDRQCKVRDFKVDGNVVTWNVECEGDHPVTGSGKITYSGDTYDGFMTMSMGGYDIKATYKGKWISSECDKQ